MVKVYLLRDGTGEHHVVNHGMIPIEVLLGRRLSKPFKSIPTYSLGGTGGRANAVAECNGVAVMTNDPAEARRIGAVPGHFHLVFDFTPWHLNRALASLGQTPSYLGRRAHV